MPHVVRPDAFDAAVVLRAYGWIALGLGLSLVVFSPLGGNSAESLVWLVSAQRGAGWLLIAAACCAVGLASADRAEQRRRSLGFFAAAHGLVAVGIAHAFFWPLGRGQVDAGWVNVAFTMTAGVGLALAYCWSTTEGDTGGAAPIAGWFSNDGVSPPAAAEQSDQSHRDATPTAIRALAQQEERHRLARDLHDSVKQQVFVIHTAAATAEARLDDDPDGSRAAIAQVRASAREAMAELEAMLDQLRAVPLEITGLVGTLRKQVDALRFRTGAAVDLVLETLPSSESLPSGVANEVFRIAQEALANCARHSRAAHITVHLAQRDANFEMIVRDDGVGFAGQNASSGMGLANMRTRAAEIGGKLSVSTGSQGTTVMLLVPLLDHWLARYHSDAVRRVGVLTCCLVAFGIIGWRFGVSPIVGMGTVVVALALGRNLLVYVRTRPRSS